MLTPLRLPTVAGDRDESGAAVAIICAFMALIAFTFAALTVDLGDAVARRGDTQAQVDFGALAGASFIDGGNTRAATAPAVQAVADYMFATCRPTTILVTSSRSTPLLWRLRLVDANTTNGDDPNSPATAACV